jgi:hypothetical protein
MGGYVDADANACAYDNRASALTLPPLNPIFEAWTDKKKEVVYDWQEPIAYGRFVALRENVLATNSRIRVVVEDFDYLLDCPTDECLMVASWTNHDGSVKIPVVFTVNEGELAEELSAEGESVYYVTVNNHKWHSFAVVQHKEADKQRGYPYLWATMPVKLQMQTNHQVH